MRLIVVTEVFEALVNRILSLNEVHEFISASVGVFLCQHDILNDMVMLNKYFVRYYS